MAHFALQIDIAVDERQTRKLQEKLDKKAREDFIQATWIQVMKHGRLLHDTVRRNASGRPGPEIVTGAYVNSWFLVLHFVQNRFVTASVFTLHPAAWRLEYGFVGVDRLGRHYNQPPFPHAIPALQEVAEIFAENIVEFMKEWAKPTP